MTGATGFIGAHVVDSLLRRGLRVRCATRSKGKGQALIESRPEYASKLDLVLVEDFQKLGVFDDAIKDVDSIIHVASVCLPETWKYTLSAYSLIHHSLLHMIRKTMKKSS